MHSHQKAYKSLKIIRKVSNTTADSAASLQLRKYRHHFPTHINKSAPLPDPSIQPSLPILNTDTAYFRSSDAHLCRAFAPGVDPRYTCFQLCDDFMSEVRVFSEYASSKPRGVAFALAVASSVME
jgi:hypothetical protein